MKATHMITALLLLCSFWSCKKDEDNTQTLALHVQVEFPDTYQTIQASGVNVTVKNSFTGEEKKISSDTNGEAAFTGLLPGVYQITASRELNAEEGLQQTGIAGEVFLNATISNHSLQESGNVTLKLKGSSPGGWLIKEIYYTGAPGAGFYSNDQFYELYNNSADTLYADGLSIGDAAGNPYVSPSSKPSGFASDTEYVYFQNIFTVPGDGATYPVAPGKSFLIARSAINHKSDVTLGNPNSPVDLGKGIADMEVYWEQAGRDTDNPDVPNMIVSFFMTATMHDWITSVFGPSIVLFQHDNVDKLPLVLEPGSTNGRTYPQVPVSAVIDAIDCVRNSSVGHFKRLPTNIDAGFQFSTNSYTGESLRRKVKTEINGRKILQNTNNSSADFELIKTPTPKSW